MPPSSVSALLITLNSSLNFIIYCAMCRNFREERVEWKKRLLPYKIFIPFISGL